MLPTPPLTLIADTSYSVSFLRLFVLLCVRVHVCVRACMRACVLARQKTTQGRKVLFQLTAERDSVPHHNEGLGQETDGSILSQEAERDECLL